MTRPIQHFGSILERSTFPPTGCLASPSTHESVNTDQTRRSVFFTCIGKLTRDYRSTQSRVLRDLITSVLYEERGSSVFCGFVRIILSRLIIQKYFCLIIRYVFIFSFMFAPLEIYMWYMYIATFTLLVI